MSVEALAIVLHHSRAKGTAKLVLVGIANHEGDGGSWPTVATLARYANVHPRNVQHALVKLQQLGELAVDPQAGGLGNVADCDRPNLYRVQVRCPTWCDGTPQHRDMRKRAGAQLSSWHGPQLVDSGVALSPPPGATATPPGGAVATPPPGAAATQNHPHNHPQNTGGTPTVTTRVDELLARADALPSCSVCGQAAKVCLRIAEPVSGHRYTQRPAAADAVNAPPGWHQ